MDSFGICGENQIKKKFFIDSQFYSYVWIVNALSIVCSEMLKLSRNNQNIKMSGVPLNTLPLVIYIRDILLLGIITLQHVIQNYCQWV